MDVSYEPAEARLEVSIIENELVVLNLDNGCYYSIEGLGIDVWFLASMGATRGSIVKALSERYGQPEDTVYHEVTTFLDKLVDEDLFSPVETEGSSAADISGEYSGWQPIFAPAIISKYDDLTETFALDPPLVIGEV